MCADIEQIDKELIDKELIIYILGVVISNIDEKGEFDFNESSIEMYFTEHIIIFKIEQCLHYLCKNEILSFGIYDEDDGRYADWFIRVDNKVKIINELTSCIKDIKEERITEINNLRLKIKELEYENTSLLNFDPDMMKKKIEDTTISISLIKKQIQSNQVLSSLSPVIDEMNHYIKGISNINEIYQDVYKNIIKPIQKESKSGVKTTAVWSIISILITTVVSILITYLFNAKH